MQKIDWLELSLKLFEIGGKKTYHVTELAELAEGMHMIPPGLLREDFQKSLNGFLANNVKTKSPQFSKRKNKQGKFRKGIYALKPQKTMDFTPVRSSDVDKNFTGSAGEHAVMSELLFRGFNASIMTVDQGIDVIASKGEKYFHIQVKTANHSDSRPYQATIRQKTFTQSTSVFYVVVLRQPSPVGYVNWFAVFPSNDIYRWKRQGILKGETTINLRVSIDKQKFLLNGEIDVTSHINDFDSIV